MKDQLIRVLLVGNNEDDYTATGDMLAEVNGRKFDVQWISTYQDALTAIEKSEHDVCLVDDHVGQHTGLELLQDACRLGCKAPLILLIEQDAKAADEAMRAGAADYLHKNDITATLLDQSIRHGLERARMLEQLHRSEEQLHRSEEQLHKSEERLHQSEEQLRQAQKIESIGTLTGGVAHDFNNLLAVIIGNTQLALIRAEPETPLQRRLVEIEKTANRAAVLTRRLLSFSRQQRLERRTTNLNETINDIIKMLQRLISADIEIRVQAQEELSPIFADSAQIEQVVMNLAVNARDAMPNGGLLLIETHNRELDAAYCRLHPYAKPGKYAQIMISDTGTGMSAETRRRIFEPFFTTKDVDKGTGLGLAMVYGIVKQHDGLVEVYSEVGLGTTFKIYLPGAEQTVEEDEEKGATHAPLRGGAETILVGEDEESLRDLTRDVLTEVGYKVMLARDGEEAVRMYEANHEQIDLVMLDMIMPRMGGFEAYEQMLSRSNGVPAVFMTSYSAEMVQHQQASQSSSVAVANAAMIQKPYNVEALRRTVREVLDEAKAVSSK